MVRDIRKIIRSYINRSRSVLAFSLVEVLISLVLLSTVLIYLLQLTSRALHQAKLLQIKRDMNNGAVYISSVIDKLMLSDYRDDNWSMVLKDGLTLVKTGSDFDFGSVVPDCRVIGNTVTSVCPGIAIVAPELGDGIGYAIDVNDASPIYTVSITVACKEGAASCDPRRLLPIKLVRILIQQ